VEQASPTWSRVGRGTPGVRLIRIAGSAVLVLFVAFQFVNPRHPVRANTPGFGDPVAGFELSSRPEHVLGILGRPGDPERPAAVRGMRHGLYLDYGFLVAYPTFYVGIALVLAARGGLARGLAAAVVGLAVVMAAGDALENWQLLRLTETVDPGAMAAPLARLRVFTLAKWYALFAASAVLVPALWRLAGGWRWSAPLFALAAALGFASVVHLPAIEWAVAPLGVGWTIVWVTALRSA
jgi:hypothetical protein